MSNSTEHGQARRTEAMTTILNQDYLTVRPLQDWLRQIATGYARGVLLDAGCGNKPYASIFAETVKRYIGVDVQQNTQNTVEVIVDPSGRLPFQDGCFHTVLSTQVLEHVREPVHHLQEFARVLRPDGVLVLTVPGSYMLHEEPHDYYRFTLYGLQYLLQQSSFRPVRIDTAGGAWRLLGQTLVNHKSFGRKWHVPLLSSAVYYATVLASNIFFSLLDDFNTNRKDPANYLVIAQRETKR